MNKRTPVEIHTIHKLLLFFLILLSTSCAERGEYQSVEQTPAYVEPATIDLGKLRESGKFDGYRYYLDSIYTQYFGKSIQDDFYVWYLYADSYSRIGKRDAAATYTDSIIMLLNSNTPSLFARDNYLWAYYFKADIQLRLGDLDEAYRHYYEALSMAEAYNDKCAIGYYYLKIGLVLFSTEQYKDALDYYRQAYEYCLTCENNFGYFYRTRELLNDIGLCFERMNEYDSAIIYYNKGLTLLQENKDRFPENRRHLVKLARSIFEGNLGGAYLSAGKADSAEMVLKKALAEPSYPDGEPIDAQYTRLKLAQVYVSRGELSAAKGVLDNVLTINDTLPDNNVMTRWNKVMWLYWDKKKNIPKAYAYLNKYREGVEAARAKQRDFLLASIDHNVKNIGNEYKIAALEQTASQRKLYIVVLVALALLSIVIVVLVINNLRKSKKHVAQLTDMNQQVEEQKQKLNEALSDLKNADQEKDRILKAVSHDMRSPVNSVLALNDLLLTGGENLNEEQLEYLRLMKKSGENALNLTKDLLEVATLSTEKLEKEPIDITSEIDARVKLMQFKASEKDQKIVFEAPANHVTANVNGEKLLRVIGNLVNNAMKFSPKGSEVVVKLSADKKAFHVMVKDSGIGIPDSIREKVFDLFSEAKRFGTSGEQPYGLGLSISKQIVEAHGGKIWFESIEGEGTTFYIDIPL